MGWKEVKLVRENKLLKDIEDNSLFIICSFIYMYKIKMLLLVYQNIVMIIQV